MKEQALIDEQVRQVQNHPGNINSNLGENLPFKEKLETIVENSSSIHSEFDVALNGICDVIKKIDNYISSMNGIKINSKRIRAAPIETQYYPETQGIHVNEVVMNPQVQGIKNVLDNAVRGVKLTPHKSAHVNAVKAVKTVKTARNPKAHKVTKAPKAVKAVKVVKNAKAANSAKVVKAVKANRAKKALKADKKKQEKKQEKKDKKHSRGNDDEEEKNHNN